MTRTAPRPWLLTFGATSIDAARLLADQATKRSGTDRLTVVQVGAFEYEARGGERAVQALAEVLEELDESYSVTPGTPDT